ncbi:hypothetical protein BD310DRAFT_912437 [Dichomitus squalens]|uniref:Uncharacterized protein n=1 Tax=Dichomitus squalens TaxID=114155 RepID=A0A4Q9QFG9_9APHY|nr:hypothetical protein BD310DRAFT_912437 [Dichomitus squalens]
MFHAHCQLCSCRLTNTRKLLQRPSAALTRAASIHQSMLWGSPGDLGGIQGHIHPTPPPRVQLLQQRASRTSATDTIGGQSRWSLTPWPAHQRHPLSTPDPISMRMHLPAASHLRLCAASMLSCRRTSRPCAHKPPQPQARASCQQQSGSDLSARPASHSLVSCPRPSPDGEHGTQTRIRPSARCTRPRVRPAPGASARTGVGGRKERD